MSNFINKSILTRISTSSYFFFSFSFILIILFSLNLSEILHPKDGVYNIGLAESFYKNFFEWHKIETIQINKKIHSPQLGASFILFIFYFLNKKFFLYFFLITVLFLYFLCFKIICKNSIFFFKKNYFVLFLILVFFQFDILRTSSSFYNESIYYPFFIIAVINFFLFINNKKIENLYLLYVYFLFGIFFQLQHILFCLSFFLTSIIFWEKLSNKENKKKIFSFLYLSIISFILFFLLIFYLKEAHIYEDHFSGSKISNLRIFQIFFSPFVSAVNLHFFFTKYLTVWPISETEFQSYNSIFIYFGLPFLLFIICVLSLIRVNIKIFIFIITIYLFSSISKLFIHDYDIRYNIYINFFISYLFVHFLYYKNFLNKNLIFFYILFVLTLGSIYFYYYLNSTFKIISNNNILTNNLSFNSQHRKTYQNITLLKKIKTENKIENIDTIITDLDPRLVFWITKMRTCKIDDYFKNNCQKNQNYIFLLNNNQFKILKNKKNIKIYLLNE